MDCVIDWLANWLIEQFLFPPNHSPLPLKILITHRVVLSVNNFKVLISQFKPIINSADVQGAPSGLHLEFSHLSSRLTPSPMAGLRRFLGRTRVRPAATLEHRTVTGSPATRVRPFGDTSQ